MNGALSYMGKVNGPLAGLDALLVWVVRAVWLNFWWLLLSLVGGVILGIGPATAAAHTVAAAWIRGEQDVSVPRTMWASWRSLWLLSVVTSLLAMVIVAALATTWLLSRGQSPLLAAITQGMVLLGLILMAVIAPHLMWITARTHHQHMTVARVYLAALATGVARPVLTLVIFALGAGWPIFLATIGWPGLIPISGAAVPVLCAAWCIRRIVPSHFETSDGSPLSSNLPQPAGSSDLPYQPTANSDEGGSNDRHLTP